MMPEGGIPWLGRLLMVAGVVLLIVGGLLTLAGKIPWLGRLPGDISIQREHFTLYLPITTSVLISVLLSLLIWLLRR